MKKILNYIVAFTLLTSWGCSDWLDVDPKSQVKEDALFKNEAGFRDALIGIYTIMAHTGSYGGQATMGTVEVLAQNYSEVSTKFNNTLKYDYSASDVQTLINGLWSANYNAIANCNYLLKNIDQKKSVFSSGTYEMVKAETMALRAFLHFDLLRGFAPSYAAAPDKPGIPFIDKVTNKPVAQETVTKVLDRIITELDSARHMIRDVDPLGPVLFTDTTIYSESRFYNNEDYMVDDGFRLNRKSRFNYYGITGLLARVYLYKKEYAHALACAKEVIETPAFALITEDDIKNTFETFVGLLDDNEYISSLYVYDLKEDRSDLFFKEKGTYEVYIGDKRRSDVFGIPGVDVDWRNQKLFSVTDGDSKEYLAKYRSGYRIPLIKLSEMYLIAAEASGDATWLQKLRDHRGYANYPLGENFDLQQEIQTEYQKEFLGEGQLFYYYKRLNLKNIPYSSVDMTSVYVFPVPDDELEFGDIK